MTKTLKTKDELKEKTRRLIEEEQEEFKRAAEYSAAKKEKEREKETQKLSVRDILEKPQKVKKLMESEPVLFSEEDREEDEKSPLWYKEFEKNLREETEKGAESGGKNTLEKDSEKEETKYLSPTVRASIQRSNNIYNAYKSGEEWLMSEGDEDLIKGIINNIRSAIGTGVEDLAYAINDFAPWYKPAKNVYEKNMAGEISEKAERQFGNATENGAGENLVNLLDTLSKNAGYNIFGAKAGNYTEALGEGFGEYRRLREQGYSKEEAAAISLGKVSFAILLTKADDYLGKNNILNNIEKNNKSNIINMDMQFFAEKDLTNQSSNALKRGIRSLTKEIELHEEKIKKPKNYDKNWDTKSEIAKKGLLKHWEKEIKNLKDSINNRIEELSKRGDYND